MGRLTYKLTRHRPIDSELAPTATVAAHDEYSFRASHRRMAWLLRLSVAINVMLGAAVTVTAQTIAALVPLKETEIALVRTYEPDDRLYRVEPISKDVDGFDLLLESKARRYVRLMLEIDPVTQTERFREAFAMTDKAFYERFKEERIDTKEVQKALSSGLVRTIRVESADALESYGDEYKYAVDLVQIDTLKGEEIQRKSLRAYLSMTTRPQDVRAEDKFTNPLGITVLDMVLKEKA